VRLSISRAWDDTSGFIARETKLIVPIALALLFLPGVIAALAAPVKRGEQPGGTFLLLLFAQILIGLVGQIAIARLALGEREPVGAAIRHAAMRVPALFGSVLIPMLPIAIVATLLGGTATVVVTMVATIIVGVRCLLNTAIAAAEPGGPVLILKRAFAITRGQVLRLLGAALLLGLGGLVVIVALDSVVGLVVKLAFDKPAPWSVAALLIALVGAAAQAAFSVVFTVFFARAYSQLASGEPGVPSSAT
jgi:hypothetical protein